MRARLVWIVVAMVALWGAACGGAPAARPAGDFSQKYTVRFSASVDNVPWVDSLRKWGDKVHKDTHGAVTVQVFPNSQLGSEETVLPAVRNGSIDGAQLSDTIMQSIYPEIAVLDLPFIFADYQAEEKAMNGAVGKRISSALAPKGLVVLGYTYAGARDVLATKPITNVNGFQKLKIRVPSSKLYITLFRSLGAIPTPIAITDALTALQTGTVQAVEGPPSSLMSLKFVEVAKNLAITNHSSGVQIWTINSSLFHGMPKTYQQILMNDAKALTSSEWGADVSADKATIETMKTANGVKVTTIDEKSLRQKTQSAISSYASSAGLKGALYKDIVNSAASK